MEHRVKKKKEQDLLKGKLPEITNIKEIEQTPQVSFRDRLVDFLMYF
jgi:hypothetical protein